ncbi:hypothetical protein DWF74_26580 [Pseudomonas protegens]|nr:hypothetical protein DWF74_26580 [Pseudomonas protegens]
MAIEGVVFFRGRWGEQVLQRGGLGAFLWGFGVHIYFCGSGGWWFRFYSGELGGISIPAVTATYGFALTASPFFSNAKKRNQKTLAPPWAPR